MGIHIQCPACGAHGSDTTSPDARWGMLYDELEMELAVDVGRDGADDDQDSYSFIDRDGRRTFECPCKRAIWIADRREPGRPPTGRWFADPAKSET